MTTHTFSKGNLFTSPGRAFDMLSSFTLVPLERSRFWGLVGFKVISRSDALWLLGQRFSSHPTDPIRRFSKSTIPHMTPRPNSRKESARSHKFTTVSFIVTYQMPLEDCRDSQCLVTWQQQFSFDDATFRVRCSVLLIQSLQDFTFG